VNGLWSGYTGEGSKTIIPAQASAKISMRLVPNQDSQDIAEKFTKFVHNITPKGVTVEIKQHTASEPVLVNRDSDYFKYAENAFIDVFGNKPLYELSGGSIGVVVDFKNTLGIDSLMMGYGLPDDGLHSPNEKMSLAMLKKGVETNVAFLRNVSDATIEGSS
jgi:acetylornithine deacetylase/succinyl-diaminopimelate desuccinylase-like protein